jgi:hypothetical protein
MGGLTRAQSAHPLSYVPEADAFVLTANGWLKSAMDAAGTTAQRPAANHALGISPPRVGLRYYDTTIGATVIWNGQTWVYYATGAAA